MAEKPAGVDDVEVASPATKGASSEKPEAGEAGAVFVYGTLMHGKVLMALLGRVPKTWKARLDGYHRYRIKGYNFPGVRPKEGSSVGGLYMPGLDAREKLIFDLFEDEEYHKVDVRVEVERYAGTQLATVYVWNASAEDQLFSTWEPSEHFAPDGKIARDYVARVEGFAREIQEESSVLQAGET